MLKLWIKFGSYQHYAYTCYVQEAQEFFNITHT